MCFQSGLRCSTTLSATQGVRAAGGWPAPGQETRVSNIEFHLAAHVPRIHAHPRDAMEG